MMDPRKKCLMAQLLADSMEMAVSLGLTRDEACDAFRSAIRLMELEAQHPELLPQTAVVLDLLLESQHLATRSADGGASC